MIAKMLNIKTADGLCDSYVAYPEGQTNLPVILFFMDAVGLRPRIFEMVQKFASHGYFVIAPNLFYRSRPAPLVDYEKLLKPEHLPQLFSIVLGMLSELSPDMGKRDAADFLKFIRERPETDEGKVVAVGYCMGGGQALRAAAHYPDAFRAVASFHAGRLATESESSPHRLLGKVRAELLIAHADHDKSMPPEEIARLQQALDASKLRYRAEIYKDAAHGFTMADLPAFNAAAEQKHWDESLALFERVLRET